MTEHSATEGDAGLVITDELAEAINEKAQTYLDPPEIRAIVAAISPLIEVDARVRILALERALRDALDWIDHYVPADLRATAKNLQRLRALASPSHTSNEE